MQNKKILYLTQAAMIAALYVVLTLIANALGLANHAIQLRFSEALTILPYFTPAAIPGLFIGCIISNIFAGGILLDIIFGSIATLIGAIGTYALRRFASAGFHSDNPSQNAAGNAVTVRADCSKGAFSEKQTSKYNARILLLPLPPIIANTIIVPLVLKYGYGIPGLIFNAVTVCIGEILSCGVLGILLLFVLNKHKNTIFGI